MVSIATHTRFFVLLCVAVAADTDQPMQGNVNDTATIVGSVVMDSSVAKDAVSALMVQAQAVSEMREAENVMYQRRYARDTLLSDSLLKDVKRSKNLQLTSSLQVMVDEAVTGVEEAISLEQAAQRSYEKTMKSMNSHIQALVGIAAGNVEQANSTLPIVSNRGPKSVAGLQESTSPLTRGDRVKLLSAQPEWNPPLPIGAEGTVLTRLMFQTNASFVRVKFDQGIIGGLLSKHLQKMQLGREVMV